ncbi:MAG TPA: DeoR family transcriptional regulator [Microscillaceae bacterium]|nr:DeoR family transcriptional regulator [Microscillaceae bacterium]
MTLEELKQFFEERPSLSINGVNNEAGLTDSYLGKILKDIRPLTPKTLNKIIPVLEKYGYSGKKKEK